MKRVLFAAAVLCCITSCETKVAGTTDAANAIAEKNAEGTRQVYKALETGDTKALDTLFTDDVIDHNAGDKGQDIKGKDSVIASVGQMHKYFDNLKMEMLHHATSPDGVYHYSTVRMSGKAKENPWGMPVGMMVEHTGVDLVKLNGTKCSEHWNFMSMKDVLGMQAPAVAPANDKKK